MLLMIDNYDSFTHNVVRYFRELKAEVKVVRNDEFTLTDIEQLPLSGIVISPGPCTPNEAGISLAVIEHFAGKLPILGVCLGHQAIGQVFGATVVRSGNVMHGKASSVAHTQAGLFHNLPNPIVVARYHSLILASESIPKTLIVDAWTTTASGEREVMAIRHRDFPIWGVQYHPEAIQTEHGHQLLANWLQAINY